MGWEKRGNKKYYYRKKRVGKKVVSEYIGSGPKAEKIAREDEQERCKRKINKQAWERRRAEMDAIDQELDLMDFLIRILIDVHLRIHGYHNHKGDWRKKRNGL